MLAVSFSALSLMCLLKRLGMSVLRKIAGNFQGGCLFESVIIICCSSLLEDASAIPSV